MFRNWRCGGKQDVTIGSVKSLSTTLSPAFTASWNQKSRLNSLVTLAQVSTGTSPHKLPVSCTKEKAACSSLDLSYFFLTEFPERWEKGQKKMEIWTFLWLLSFVTMWATYELYRAPSFSILCGKISEDLRLEELKKTTCNPPGIVSGTKHRGPVHLTTDRWIWLCDCWPCLL